MRFLRITFKILAYLLTLALLLAAAIYAWHCPDDSPLFVATWYTIAISMVTAVGFLLGRRLLRW